MSAARVIALPTVRSRQDLRQAEYKVWIDKVDRVLPRLEKRMAIRKQRVDAARILYDRDSKRAARIEHEVLARMADENQNELLGNEVILHARPNAVSVQVDDPTKLPKRYRRTKTITEAKRVDIKVALERAEAEDATQRDIAEAEKLRAVPGLRLTRTVSLVRKKGAVKL